MTDVRNATGRYIDDLERYGWEFLYSSSPDGDRRRYLFVGPDRSSHTFIGIGELRLAANVATATANERRGV